MYVDSSGKEESYWKKRVIEEIFWRLQERAEKGDLTYLLSAALLFCFQFRDFR